MFEPKRWVLHQSRTVKINASEGCASTPLYMTDEKWFYTRSLINEWLAKPGRRCANCEAETLADCDACDRDDCYISTNMQCMQQVIKQNFEQREQARNDFNATEGKTMRGLLSIPPGLLKHLELGWLTKYQRGFLSEKGELHKFAKKFPQLTIARKV